MNINKNISVWRGDDTPPTKYHLWIKSDGTQYIFDGTQWKKSEDQIPIAKLDTDGLMSKEDKKILNDLNADYPIYKEQTNSKIKSLESKDTEIESTLSNEITRAIESEQTIATNLSNEIINRENAISSTIESLDSDKSDEGEHVSIRVIEENGKLASVTLTENDIASEATLNNHINNTSNPHEVTKTLIGLSNVTNDALVKRSEMGVTNGVATLNNNGKIPSSQLPSYVDDILEYNTISEFPTTGESGKIYVSKDTNLTYRWTGSGYAEISQSLALGETSSTAYAGDKGKAVKDSLDSLTNVVDTKADKTQLDNYYTKSQSDDRYVNINGDTMSGMLRVYKSGRGIELNSTATESLITMMYNDVAKGGFGWYNGTYGTYMYNYSSSKYLGIRDDGTPYFDGNTLWHSGNDGAGSGLDADLLDGMHSSVFSQYAHYNLRDSATGWLKIKIKSTVQWMLSFTIRSYQAYTPIDIQISGYNYGSYYWYEPKARMICGYQSMEVKFGYDSTYNLWVAIPIRYFPSVSIFDVNNGDEQVENWGNLFEIVPETELSGTVQTSVICQPSALISDNVASASKLQTARSIWGQSFDGTGDIPYNASPQVDICNFIGVDGSSVVGYVGRGSSNSNEMVLMSYTARTLLGANSGVDLIINELHNVGIGTTSPAYKLDVNGDVRADSFIKSDGTSLLILMADGSVRDINDIVDFLSYGVEWKPNVADPHLTRVGNMTYHKTLPIQSQMKGCVINPKTKLVAYWLDESDWKYKKGGNPNKGEPEQLSRLDGYDGEVMVYVPEFWIKSWDETDRRCVKISPVKIDDSWEHQPACYIGAYKDTVLREVPSDMGYLSTLEVNTAICVANNNSYCRGGNNDATNDTNEDIFKRQLGKPATLLSRATMRTYERQAGKEILSYRQYKNILYWLYVIEYANFNCLEEYNIELTTEGFKQGGLGAGITNVGNWNEYNGYYPICPNGYTNELGNNTGIKLITPLGPAPVSGVYAIRWRGIENPFGDTWNNVDGIIIDADSANHPNDMNYVYTTDDPTKYNDSSIEGMTLSGLEIHQDGYAKEWDLGSTAEIIPRLMGGSTTLYKCDYHWVGERNVYLRTLLLGSNASNGSYAGLGYFNSYCGAANSDSTIGFRSVLSFA